MEKKLIVILTCVLTFVLFLGGCAQNAPETEKYEYSEDQIVFIMDYANWAEGYRYRATYVTANGNVYNYSFEGDYSSYCYQVEDVLEFPRDNVMETYSEKDMDYLINELGKVGNIEFEKKPYACDYGSYTVYGVTYDEDGKAKVIMLGIFGDTHSIPNDKHAREICKFFGIDWKN